MLWKQFTPQSVTCKEIKCPINKYYYIFKTKTTFPGQSRSLTNSIFMIFIKKFYDNDDISLN